MRNFAKLLLPLLALTVSVNMSSKSIDSYEYDFEVDSIFYTIHEDGVYVSAEKYIYKFNYTAAYYGYYNEDLSEVFSNYRGELVIPETVTFNDSVYKVVGIECFAFKGCVGLEKVYIPSSVRTIGICAFYKCSGLKEVVLPQSLNSIEYSLFNGCSELVSLVIPDSVTVIEGLAFYGCSSLKEIVVPEGIESILESTFEYCSSLVGITLPGTLKSIGKYAFYGCANLRELYIPDSVKRLGGYMIHGCKNLKYLTIPEGVEEMDRNAFYLGVTSMEDKCDSMQMYLFDYANHIRITPGQMTIYKGGIDVLQYLPVEVLSMSDNGFFKYIIGPDIDSIPDFFKNNNDMLWNLWYDRSWKDQTNVNLLDHIESLYVPENVKYIGTSAFCGCTNLKEVVIEGSPVIGEYAFAGCDSIERIVLSGETPPEINSNTVVSLSANVEAEDWDQSLSMVVKLDRTVPMEGASGGYASYFIEDGAFNWKISFQLDYAIPGWYDVKVKAVPNKLFPEVEDVENAEDVKPAILAVTVKYTDKDGVKQSYTRKDPSNSRKSFTFVMDGDSIMTLDAARLYLGDMKKEGERQIVTVEVQSYVSNSNAKKYSHGAWIDCLSLELVSVTDPSDVEDAYSDLEPLADEQSFSDIIRQRLLSLLFTDEVYSNAELIIPEGSLNYYMESEIWSRFKSLSGIDPVIYKSDFESDSIYYTVQPGGAMVAAREVNRGKFRDNFGFDGPLTPRDPIAGGQQPRTPMRVHTMNSLGTGADTVLVDYAPYSGNLVIPESVSANDTTYRVVGTDYYAFIGCTELETVSFPESVTTLGYGSFAGCSGLKGLNIPSGVGSIPDAMFYGCTSLDGVVLPEGIATIGHSAFYNCSGLTEIVIPASVELIDEYAFFGCTGLKRIVIEGNPEIAPTAFLDCGTGLEIIKTGIESIDTDHREVYGPVHYGIDGRPVAADAPGLHIIRMPDGRMKKALILSR